VRVTTLNITAITNIRLITMRLTHTIHIILTIIATTTATATAMVVIVEAMLIIVCLALTVRQSDVHSDTGNFLLT